jgi:hypothetical protein
MATIPQLQLDANISGLTQTVNDIITFLRERNEQGIKFQSFTQEQIDNFTDLSFEGTIVYNTTTQEANVSYVENEELLWRAF